MRDLASDVDFPGRRHRAHDTSKQLEAFRDLAQVFATDPDVVLNSLVQLAVRFCGAESAGVSLEEPDDEGKLRFRWIAVAGTFERFLHGTTPRFFSPCGSTLAAGCPQLYRVSERYYDFLGITALPIHDGILIPWETEGMRGTLWAVSHQTEEVFDLEDYKLLTGLADFAAVAVRHQAQTRSLKKQQETAAMNAAVDRLAHEINNPLQSLANSLYLATVEREGPTPRIDEANRQLSRISSLARDVLRTANLK